MSTALIPDRRRQYFPRNGGPRPTASDRTHGRKGLADARAALEAITPAAPAERSVISRLTPEQKLRARRGVAAARAALTTSGKT